ncbi:hypothetical protein NDN08_003351 [Rhodosorus marinus]|uniref:Sulfotransferase domain-containing protein n=1 Tax=Rhodosorus marinus TaxID=101924 RepID=A0AAV8V0W1_9RHOD|nr:hypothetical protein NDN08_003351 [Rhodosorus marinus]
MSIGRCVWILLLLAVWVRGEDKCDAQEVGEWICPDLFLLGSELSGIMYITEVLARSLGDQIRLPDEGVRGETCGGRLRCEYGTQYFSWHHQKGLAWYKESYGTRNSTEEVGLEVNPQYLAIPSVPFRMQSELLPSRLRFIVAFRNPVARAHAAYRSSIISIGSSSSRIHEAYLAFDFKFSLIARTVGDYVMGCIHLLSHPQHVYRMCAHESKIDQYRNYHASVPETEKAITDFQLIARPFTSGLYGYIMIRWFEYFEPEQFCPLMYENLLDDFEAEIMNLEPCLEAFGATLRKDHYAEVDIIPDPEDCAGCQYFEQLTEDEMAEVGEQLNQKIFGASNDILSELMEANYKRDDIGKWS